MTFRVLWLVAVMVGCTSTVEDSEQPSDTVEPRDSDTGSSDTGLTDFDGDGYTSDVDCDDLNPEVNPGRSEVPWNDLDDDCDGRRDADGSYLGEGTVRFEAIYEGKKWTWNLNCPVALTRTRSQVSFEMACTSPADDEMAQRLMGASFVVSEKTNVAEAQTLRGEVEVSSSDGWTSDGYGEVTFKFANEADATFSIRSVFADLDGSFSVQYSGG